MAAVASAGRWLCVPHRWCADGCRTAHPVPGIRRKEYVAFMATIRSAEDADRLVHVPFRAGPVDPFHPAQHGSVQLDRRPECFGAGPARGDRAARAARTGRQTDVTASTAGGGGQARACPTLPATLCGLHGAAYERGPDGE